MNLSDPLPPKYHEANLFFCLDSWQNEKELHADKYFKVRAHLLNLLCKENTPCCHFCGFPDGKFLEIHHLDGNHNNWAPNNLVPCCSLCHFSQHLGWVGLHNMGRLVYLPTKRNVTDSNGAIIKDIQLNLIPFINLYQRFYLLNDARTHEQNKQIANLPLSGLFNASRNIMTSFGFDELFKDANEYNVLKDALNEDRRKSASFAEGSAQNTPAVETSATDQDAPKYERGSFEHIPSKDQLTKYEEELKQKGQMSKTKYITHTLHLLDFVQSMALLQVEYEITKDAKKAADAKIQGIDKTSPLGKFLDKQHRADEGVFVVEFNPLVLYPWDARLGYTYKERIDYYTKLGLLKAQPDYTEEESPNLQNLIFRWESGDWGDLGLHTFSYCSDLLAGLQKEYENRNAPSKS